MKIIEERNIKALEYYHKNKDRYSEYKKQYVEKNKESIKEYDKRWRQDNKLKTIYHSNFYKISGYTFEEFSTYLLNLGWKPGYHVDHKIPITHFSPNTPVRLINDLRNLQPLKNKENLNKGNKYKSNVSEEYYREIKGYLVI
jgi:5-methylcytosine-specific restriction endonuclease McrA